MTCLTDYIGIKYTDAPVPESGLYINQLPGISTELIDKVADCEQGDYLGMWSDVQERAYRLFQMDIITYMLDRARLNQEVYQTKRFNTLGRSKEDIAASSEFRGIYCRLPESKYSKLFIKNLYVYSNDEITTDLKIFDCQDGTELYSLEVDLVEGMNVIQVDYEQGLRFGIVEIFIGIDCSLISTIKTDQEYYFFYGQNGCACNFNTFRHNNWPELRPAVLPSSEDPINENISLSSNGKGVWIDASIVCSIDEFICSNKKILLNAWWYLLGREVLTEKLSSYNLNYFTSGLQEKTDWLRKELDANYQKSLKNGLNGISINGDNICFDCFVSTQVKTGVVRP